MYKILSIDGGGIRGIIPGQILVEIEKEFGVKVATEFDLVTGTSTGGILTCAHLIPDPEDPTKRKFTAQEVVDLYFKMGGKIFDVPFFYKLISLGGLIAPKHPDTGLKQALEQYFGEAWLKDLLKPCLITSYDIKRRKGHFFRQHKAKVDRNYNFKVKDASRAAGSAPTYFPCAKVSSEEGESFPLIDGAVFVNNPALAAYAEGRTLFKVGDEEATAKDMKILSLGTGHAWKEYHYRKARKWGQLQWVIPVIDIMMSGASEVADYQLNQIYRTIDNPKQYLRIEGSLLGTGIEPKMDCATPANMAKLKAFGKKLFQEHKKEIEEWLKID